MEINLSLSFVVSFVPWLPECDDDDSAESIRFDSARGSKTMLVTTMAKLSTMNEVLDEIAATRK